MCNLYNAAVKNAKAWKNIQKFDALLFGGEYANRCIIDSKVFKRTRQTRIKNKKL